MKNLLILIITSLTLLSASVSREWIDTMVREIQPKRFGLSVSELNRLKDPFVETQEEQNTTIATSKKRVARSSTQSKVKDHRFTLLVTMNNSAKINDRWYRLQETISGFTLSKITKTYVVLKKNKNTSIIVHLNKANNNLHMTTK